MTKQEIIEEFNNLIEARKEEFENFDYETTELLKEASSEDSIDVFSKMVDAKLAVIKTHLIKAKQYSIELADYSVKKIKESE